MNSCWPSPASIPMTQKTSGAWLALSIARLALPSPLPSGGLRCDECHLPIEGSVTINGLDRRPTSLCLSCSLRVPHNHSSHRRRAPIEAGRIRRKRCAQCGRIMRLIWARGVEHCCDACKAQAYNERRRVARKSVHREVCGSDFTPPRSDARTCSNRCRQTAHRARRRA
jgi:hypothetical protein